MQTKIPRNVVVMGIVSFFNDVASEMIYPVVPLFLTTVIGAPIAAIGIIEGIAEATAAFLKIASGWISDKVHKRKAFVVFGYSLATAGKVLIGFANSAGLVLAGRFLDKVGKGTRTTPRDALIAESVPKGMEGTAFGFHRALDTAGAIFGPLIAVALIAALHENLRPIFFIASVPALIGIVFLVMFVEERPKQKDDDSKIITWNWSLADARLKLFLVVTILFSLGNSSDAFLILRAKNLGLSTTLAILAYAFFSAVYAGVSYPAGKLADKIGPRKILQTAFVIFAITYTTLGLVHTSWSVWILFPLYGMFMGLTDGIGQAYISELVPRHLVATALGMYQASIGFSVLIASIVAGFTWEFIGPQTPFLIGGTTAAIAAVVFFIGSRKTQAI